MILLSWIGEGINPAFLRLLEAGCPAVAGTGGALTMEESDLSLFRFAGGLMDRLDGVSVAAEAVSSQKSALTRLRGGSESIMKL